MEIREVHEWLGRVSGGMRPLSRWCWASLVAMFWVGFSYFLILILDFT